MLEALARELMPESRAVVEKLESASFALPEETRAALAQAADSAARRSAEKMRQGLASDIEGSSLTARDCGFNGPGTVTGASTFIALWDYIQENAVVQTLEQSGRNVFLHSVVTGGQAMLDTLSGLHDVASKCPARNLVIWANEFFGPVEYEGKRLSEMKVFARHRDRIRGTGHNPQTKRRHLYFRIWRTG